MPKHARAVAAAKTTPKKAYAFWLAVASLAMGLTACGSASSDASSGTGGSTGGTGGTGGIGSSAATGGGASGSFSGGATGVPSSTGGSGSGASAGVPADAVDAGSGGASGGAANNDAGGIQSTDDAAVVTPNDGAASTSPDGGQDMYPLRLVLPLFSAPDVPARGPAESPPSRQTWTPPATLPARVGMGIAQHPMLYVGENYDRITLVNGGKVVWTYDTAPGYELDDVWMLSNGNILYSHMSFIEEITPKKVVVWHYAPTNGEIHTCQPIGLDRVLFMENALPMASIRLYNKKTGQYEVDHSLVAGTAQQGRHGQFRRLRMTAKGTYLASFMGEAQVVEYDKNFNVVWTYKTPRPWSGVRLKNGNTLIQDESLSTSKEVDSAGLVVWQLAKTDLVLPAGLGNTQSCERLSSGNTVMFGNGGTNVNNIQAVEVTPAKQIVWVLQDWIHLGDATSAQFLDEPGYPEVPGDTNH